MKKIYLFWLLVFFCGSVQAQSKRKTEHFTCYFDYNSASWHKDSVARLDAWIRQFLEKDAVAIELTAYTDTIGSVMSNQALAERRLASVRKYFDEHGLALNKTIAAGENYDKSGYKNNALHRKVDIRVEYEEQKIVSEPGIENTIEQRVKTFETSTAPVNLNIQFVGGQDVYIGDSYLDVVALLRYMKENPAKKVFIRGHVCCENDVELSTRRAFAVYNDLILEGISPDRVSYKGFGNSMPAVDELDEFTRQQNRRVDVVFSDK